MLLQLIIPEKVGVTSDVCSVWLAVSNSRGVKLEVVEADKPVGKELVDSLGLSTLPALVIDGVVKVIGTPDVQTAENVLDNELKNTLKRFNTSEN